MRILMIVVLTSACGSSGGGSDAADADPDGDGVAATIDNCPLVANADQHDHDGDAKGDACDPCPHLAGLEAGVAEYDEDTDADGIGRGCDPWAFAGDARVGFYGMYGAAELAGFTMNPPGAWSVIDGKLRLAAATAGAYVELPVKERGTYVTIGFTGLAEGSDQRSIAISTRRTATTTQRCMVAVDPVRKQIIADRTAPPPNSGFVGTTDFTGMLTESHRMQFRSVRTDLTCIVGNRGVTTTVPDEEGKIAIVADNLAVDIDYIDVVRASP
jgi:hypothetical protein